jgi:hypothetical protein
MNKIIHKFFLAVVWGFAAHLEVKGRNKFSEYFQSVVSHFMTNNPDESSGFRKRLDYSVVPIVGETMFD